MRTLPQFLHTVTASLQAPYEKEKQEKRKEEKKKNEKEELEEEEKELVVYQRSLMK